MKERLHGRSSITHRSFEIVLFDITNYDITLFGGFDRVTSKAIIENNGSFDDHRANLMSLSGIFDIDQAYVEAGWAYTH